MLFWFGVLLGFFKEPDPLIMYSELGHISMPCMVTGPGKTLKKWLVGYSKD